MTPSPDSPDRFPTPCPGATAWGVARLRAKHQVIERGAIFPDPFALRILASDGRDLAREPDSPTAARYRRFIAARSRIAEDALITALAQGVRQIVVLGAGLDTTALRHANDGEGPTVFEVDRPVMQAWKQANLASVGLPIPPSLVLVPVDFERDNLPDCLAAGTFNAAAPAFFIWLGVTYYITSRAITQTLRLVASIPNAELVFDYSEPEANYPPEARAAVAERSRMVRSAGEPWISHFNPRDIDRLLRDAGLDRITDLDRIDIAARFNPSALPPADASRVGGHVIHAARG
jgi:methyltransferase (TIGR00027 family)